MKGEYEKKSVEELATELANLRETLFKLRMDVVSGQSQKTHESKEVRKNIARIKTAMNMLNKAGA